MDFVTVTGTLNLKGVLAIAVGKRSAKVKFVTFTRPAKGAGQLTVKLAGHKVKLFTITGRARVKRGATTEMAGRASIERFLVSSRSPRCRMARAI